MTKGEYVLIYLDTDYNWLNVYHAMNNHFFRGTSNFLETIRNLDTLKVLSESWDVTNSSDRDILNYAKTAFAIIPTPVKLDTPTFHKFWSKANEYLVNFGVQTHDTASSIKVGTVVV